VINVNVCDPVVKAIVKTYFMTFSTVRYNILYCKCNKTRGTLGAKVGTATRGML